MAAICTKHKTGLARALNGKQYCIDCLLQTIQPFADLLKNSRGRIPVEQLSAKNWHDVAKINE